MPLYIMIRQCAVRDAKQYFERLDLPDTLDGCRWSKGSESAERAPSAHSSGSSSGQSSRSSGDFGSRAQNVKLERSTSLLSRGLAGSVGLQAWL